DYYCASYEGSNTFLF
nr:immunoglobulin light chain junction region [Macaca mulatta]MOV66543.1 immunoglobulin light chain junction region [Macaca mulatta]MOV67472.1 immunoglobulin light chain junction region [Macaca mulatta]MOV67574.1 immunoglobulin light chain junction region [Macaca mulatta]MOV67845.1 immunoglobulin light chain junction region [Macaca mulatta]